MTKMERCLINAPQGTVKKIRTWKENLNEWNGDRNYREVAKGYGLNREGYRRYLREGGSFPEGEVRRILFSASGLECFSPELEATRIEIAGILKDKIPYGAEGWQKKLRAWMAEDKDLRTPKLIAKKTKIPQGSLNSILYQLSSYPIERRISLLDLTELDCFIDPRESYTEITKEKPTKLNGESKLSNIDQTNLGLQRLRNVYLEGLDAIGSIVPERYAPEVLSKVLLDPEVIPLEKRAQLTALFFYAFLDLSVSIRRDPETMRTLSDLIAPQDSGYGAGLILALGKGRENLESWMEFNRDGYLPQGVRK